MSDGRSAKVRAIHAARGNHGVLAVREAARLGVSRDVLYRLVRAGEWSLVLPTVVALSPPPFPMEQLVAAACIWGGSTAAASHESAAWLWGFTDVTPARVDLTVAGSKASPREWLTVHKAVARFAIHRRLGLPVTSVARTLVDLGSVVDEATLELALEDARRRGLTAIPRLETALATSEGRGRRGAQALRRLLDERDPAAAPTMSWLETRVLRAIREAGIRTALVRQFPVVVDGVTSYLDFAVPEQRLGIEVDGYLWHSGKVAWRRDRERLNRLTGAGWRIFHVTYDDLRDPGRLAAKLRVFLGEEQLEFRG